MVASLNSRIFAAYFTVDCQVGPKRVCEKHVHAVESEVGRIQLPTLVVDIIPEGLGSVFAHLGLNEPGHHFVGPLLGFV